MKEDSKQRRSKLFNLLNVDSLIDSVLQYFEKRIELVKIEIKEEAAVIGAKLVISMILSFLALFFLLFLSIMVGMFLNDYLDSQYMGYAYVTGFYIFLIILIQLLRKFANLDTRIETMIYQLLSTNKKPEVNDGEK